MITREEARRLAEEERAAQGLPPQIEDVGVLNRIATIMRLADRRLSTPHDKPKHKRKP